MLETTLRGELLPRTRFPARHLGRALMFMAFCAVLPACSTKPYVDYETSYPFADIRTFYIIPTQITNEPLMGPRVASAIHSELTARGFTAAGARTDADIAVLYRIGSEERPNNTRVSVGLGTGSVGRHGGTSVGGSVSAPVGGSTRHYNTVQIDMFPGDREQLIWRSSDAFEVRGSPEKKAENAHRMVQRLLSNFPPGSR